MKKKILDFLVDGTVKDEEFVSSIKQFKDFKDNVVWKDMSTVLHAYLAKFYDNLETVSSVEELKYIQGSIATIKSFLSLPDDIIRAIEIQEEIDKSLEERQEND